MSQLNIQMTPQFEEELRQFMAARGLKNKSEAVRVAVRESLERTEPGRRRSFLSWIGAAGPPEDPTSGEPAFPTHDQLWS